MFGPPTDDEEEYEEDDRDEEDEWDPPMEQEQIREQFPQYYDPAPDDDE